MLLEKDRRGLKQIADDIEALIAKENPEGWYLAFPKETNKELREMLSAAAGNTLMKCVAADLTKIHKEELLSHFE